MKPCNLVSEVKTWTSPHQVAVHLLQWRDREYFHIPYSMLACTSISSSVKALPWVLTNSTTASRSPSPEQMGWQRILAFPWEIFLCNTCSMQMWTFLPFFNTSIFFIVMKRPNFKVNYKLGRRDLQLCYTGNRVFFFNGTPQKSSKYKKVNLG